MDVHSVQSRSRNMSAIRGKNTKPEILVRQALFARGYRYRLHCQSLPGKPDIVLPKYRAIVQIQGCFWHRHDCQYFKWPDTRPEFWRSKINGTVARDRQMLYQLKIAHWRVILVWECAIKTAQREGSDTLIGSIEKWLHSDSEYLEIPDSNG